MSIPDYEFYRGKAKYIDWSDPTEKISEFFTVKEALWLPQWNRMATEADGLTMEIKANIVYFAREKMDPVRRIVGKTIIVKNWFRPDLYNKLIGGARLSLHKLGLAGDWYTDVDGDGDKDGEDCDNLKAMLLPHLETLGIRMEDNGAGARWIHNDGKFVPAGGNRFFKP